MDLMNCNWPSTEMMRVAVAHSLIDNANAFPTPVQPALAHEPPINCANIVRDHVDGYDVDDGVRGAVTMSEMNGCWRRTDTNNTNSNQFVHGISSGKRCGDGITCLFRIVISRLARRGGEVDGRETTESRETIEHLCRSSGTANDSP